jgi:hypothetical protein
MGITEKRYWHNFKLLDYPIKDKRYVYSSELNYNCDKDLEIFVSQISSSINLKRNLIVLRLADGEFQFLFGKKIYLNKLNLNFFKSFYYFIKSHFSNFYLTAATSPGISSGLYSKQEILFFRNKAKENLLFIANNGILAFYLIKKKSFDISNYFNSVNKFFKENNIVLNSLNYHPFYFVYILILNSKYNFLFKDKSVLIITGDVHRKCENVEKYLISKGFSSVEWLGISNNRSIFDQLDILQDEFDFIFIGAGIGKLILIEQLFNVNSVVIDIGFALEIMNNNNLSKVRDYCNLI